MTIREHSISIHIHCRSRFGYLDVRDQIRGGKGAFERLCHSRLPGEDCRESDGHIAPQLAYGRVLDHGSRSLGSRLDIGQNGIRIGAAMEHRGSRRQRFIRVLPVQHAVILPQAVVVLIVLDLHVVHHVESVLLVIGAPGHGERKGVSE